MAVTGKDIGEGGNYSGTYTPTFTPLVNVTVGTIKEVFFNRDGDNVTVWGEVQLVPTAVSTETDLLMSIPFDSNFTGTQFGRGTISLITTGKLTTGGVFSNNGSAEMKIRFVSTHASTGFQYGFNFTYKIV